MSKDFLRIIKWIKTETIHVIPAVIYFMIFFHLIYYTSGLMLEPGQTRYFTSLRVTIGALVAGKVLIIANAFPFINMFPKKPLIYNILWKFSIYIAFIFLLWLAENTFELATKYDDLSIIIEGIKLKIISPVFLSTLLWLSATFLIFVVASEFTHSIGKKKIMHLLLGIYPSHFKM